MRQIANGDPETRSADVIAENVDQLKALFPEAVTEGKIDFGFTQAASWSRGR